MWWIIPILILLGFIAVILIRTLNFKPKETEKKEPMPVEFDRQRVVENLQVLVRCKTVSNVDHALEDDCEFQKLLELLPVRYPNVFKTCTLEKFPDRGLLFHWKGTEEGDPAILMAHYDVVPVNEDAWTKPAFEGLIENGILWGRGSLDTKVTFNGVLSAADHLISKGFTPRKDIYFAFSGGEEVNGEGALHIVDYFKNKHITPSMVVDEGGAVVSDIFPGVAQPCGLIGIAEKGMTDVLYTAKSSGGHASAPRPNAPIDRLAHAAVAVLDHPFKGHITPPMAQMFDTLGRHSNFVYRMIFANLWLFKGILDSICKKSGGELNALMRTTVAFTQTSGSKASNVIPPEATMISNIRLNPEDTVETAVEYLKKVVNDPTVEIRSLHGMNPSPISDTSCEGWRKVASSVADTWKGCLVSPYLMMQCSDSRHYGEISDKVYRFSAMDLTAEERVTIHGNDEHIRLETVQKAVEFYIRLMSQC